MARNGQAPKMSELDRMLLRERGWSFSDTQEDILKSLEPRRPGALRRAAASALHGLARWIDKAESSSRTMPGRAA